MMRSLQAAKKPSGRLSEVYCYPAYAPVATRSQPARVVHLLGQSVTGLVTAIWYVITLPLRLLIGILGILGRLAGILLGFSIMVVGMALWAGPLYILGIPLFIIGLLLTLRCLG